MIRPYPTIDQIKARYAADKQSDKITRAAFLYMEPVGDGENFAQCGTCVFWRATNRCQIHGDRHIGADDSCGLYVESQGAATMGPNLPLVTPEESGLIDAAVRCENCRFFDETCKLFERLNELPDFDLDAAVKAKGCCNAFQGA